MSLQTVIDELSTEIDTARAVIADATAHLDSLLTPYEQLLAVLEGRDAQRQAVEVVKAAAPVISDTPKTKAARPIKHKCPQCPKEFESKAQLRGHGATHAAKTPCPKCGTQLLANHVKRHKCKPLTVAQTALIKLGATPLPPTEQIQAAIDAEGASIAAEEAAALAEQTIPLEDDEVTVLPTLTEVLDSLREKGDFEQALHLQPSVEVDPEPPWVYTCIDCHWTSDSYGDIIHHVNREHARALTPSERRSEPANAASNAA